jgi:quinol monooxygenase YgiN
MSPAAPRTRFAQHTRLVAAPGKRDELVAKFLEAAEIQRGNPACELMLVSTAPDAPDVVYLTEIWSAEDAWEQARRRPEIQAWGRLHARPGRRPSAERPARDRRRHRPWLTGG